MALFFKRCSSDTIFMSTQSTIKCSKETQSRLRGYGRMGDSFEKAIIGLLDKVEKNEI